MNIWSHSIVLMYYIRIYDIAIRWSASRQSAPQQQVAQLRSPKAVQTTYFTFPQVIDISITLHFPVELA